MTDVAIQLYNVQFITEKLNRLTVKLLLELGADPLIKGTFHANSDVSSLVLKICKY